MSRNLPWLVFTNNRAPIVSITCHLEAFYLRRLLALSIGTRSYSKRNQIGSAVVGLTTTDAWPIGRVWSEVQLGYYYRDLV